MLLGSLSNLLNGQLGPLSSYCDNLLENPSVTHLADRGLMSDIINLKFEEGAMLRNEPVGNIHARNFKQHLEESLIGILEEKERLRLLTILQNNGLCTRDVLAFARGQANRRQVYKANHGPTIRQAMRAKIMDSKGVLKLRESNRSKIKHECQGISEYRGFRIREINKKVRSRCMKIITALRTKFDKKIKHLKEIQSVHCRDSQETIPDNGQPTLVPNRLREFASLKIFGSAKDLPQQQKPIGPFITDKNIKLNASEIRILSKDPKFSLMEEPDRVEYNTEVEKSFSKHRYGQIEHEHKKENKLRIKTIEIDVDMNKEPQNEAEIDIKKIWRDESHKYIFNPFTKTMDFGKRRPTDYKLNRRVKLPKPLDADGEFLCERKRRDLDKIFTDYQNLYKKHQDKKAFLRLHHKRDKKKVEHTKN